MIVNCNGSPVSVDVRLLAEALIALGFNNRRVVVAVNDTFIPKQAWPTYQIKAGDRLDILSAIEGG